MSGNEPSKYERGKVTKRNKSPRWAAGSFLVSGFSEAGECERLSFAKFIRTADDDEDDAPPWAADTAAAPRQTQAQEPNATTRS